MRLCIVTVAGHGVGGMQDHTRTLAKGLTRGGHEVEVLTTRHPEGVVNEVRDGVHWHYLDAAHHHAWLPRRDPAWLARSREMFLRLHRERPFDLIHSESTSAIGLLRRGIHRQVPFVAKFHGTTVSVGRATLQRFRSGDADVKRREAKALVWLLGAWLQYGQWYRFRPCVWMAPSKREFDDTRKSLFLKPSLGHVVPNGIDTQVFSPRPKELVRAELGLTHLPIFVYAGRLDRAKRIHHAIHALMLLGDRGHPAQLIVLGDGEDRGRLEALTRQLRLTSRVVFTGTQPHDVLAQYLAAAEAFVFPTEHEAAPLAPLQALSCGTPVIASNAGGTAELIDRPGENGLLVGQGKPADLAAAMEQVLTDADLRQRLRAGGLARVHAEYTLERMVERTLAVYGIAQERFKTKDGAP